MCGLAGSGKSTFCKQFFTQIPVVSEDAMRYEVEDMYGYTDWEVIVPAFHSRIEKTLQEYNEIVIDASFINKAYRDLIVKFLHSLYENIIINIVVLTTTTAECLCNNNKREGRQKVDKGLIFRQSISFTDPVLDDNEYNLILYFNEKEG